MLIQYGSRISGATMQKIIIAAVLGISLLFSPASSRAEPEQKTEAGEIAASPKQGWGDFEVVEEKAPYPWWGQALLWLPNRLLDLVDVFRVDAGVGPAYGGVVRVTRYVQAGYRQMSPFSLRVGDFGRKLPVMVESSNEIGAGPAFIASKDREICTGEVGVGVDLLAGAYVGICVEELVDFAAGLVFLDIMDDDVK